MGGVPGRDGEDGETAVFASSGSLRLGVSSAVVLTVAGIRHMRWGAY